MHNRRVHHLITLFCLVFPLSQTTSNGQTLKAILNDSPNPSFGSYFDVVGDYSLDMSTMDDLYLDLSVPSGISGAKIVDYGDWDPASTAVYAPGDSIYNHNRERIPAKQYLVSAHRVGYSGYENLKIKIRFSSNTSGVIDLWYRASLVYGATTITDPSGNHGDNTDQQGWRVYQVEHMHNTPDFYIHTLVVNGGNATQTNVRVPIVAQIGDNNAIGSGTTSVAFSVDGSSIGSAVTDDDVPSSGTTSATIYYTFTTGGGHSISATVNSDHSTTESDYSNNSKTISVSVSAPVVKPVITQFAINAEDDYTFSRSVTLNNSCDNSPTFYMASEYSDFHDSSWNAYSSNPYFLLSSGCGPKTVYFKVKNSAGESDVYSVDDIQLVSYSITGASINGSFPISAENYSVINVQPGDVIQFTGTTPAPNDSFYIYLENPIALQCLVYHVHTDGSGYFNYPNTYVEAMASHAVSQYGPFMFVFDNGEKILINSKDLSSFVKFPIDTASMTIRDLGPVVPLNQMTIDSDILEYIKWNQNYMSAQTMSQFDMQAVERGRSKLAQFAKQDYLISKIDDAVNLIFYGAEATGCFGFAGADVPTIGLTTPEAVASCVALAAHFGINVGEIGIDTYVQQGKMTSQQASFWKGLADATFGVIGLVADGDTRDEFALADYIYSVLKGEGELTSAAFEPNGSDPNRYLATTWKYSGRTLSLIIKGRTPVAVHDRAKQPIPTKFSLHQNYPNPFNPTTTIKYDLPRAEHVRLTIIDALGREVSTIVNELQEPGYKTVSFDGTRLPSGIYFCRIQAGPLNATTKLMLLK